MEQHSLDHDDGIDGFSCERTFTIRPRKQVLGGAPAMVMAQIHKDKNIFTLQVHALRSHGTGQLQLLPTLCPVLKPGTHVIGVECGVN